MNRVSKLMFASIACLALASTTAFAQDATPAPDPAAPPPPGTAPAATTGGKGSKTVGADVAVVLPTGDYADGADLAAGAFGRFEFGINDQLFITGRAGVLFHIGTPEGTSILMIPILAGAKYKIGTSGLFVHGELGLNYVRLGVDVGGVSASDSETKITILGGAGYQTGKISARAGIFFTPGVGETDLLGIMGSVGYDFAAL